MAYGLWRGHSGLCRVASRHNTPAPCHEAGLRRLQHAGGADQFVGSAWLELTVDELTERWIEDIELISAGGRKATGELSFFDQQPQQHLLRDDQAQLSLRIDDGAGNNGSGNRTGEFIAVLASWIEGDGRISSAFSSVAPDGIGGIGEVAVQFIGAPCVPLRGVEN